MASVEPKRYIGQFPHCDQRILHGPRECEYCDDHPEWQELRQAWGIAFTGHAPQDLGYGRELPCPADASRPAGASNDHRRWGGNKPTRAKGDPSWPLETAASLMMYGDNGGRAQWPRFEMLRRRIAAPFHELSMRLHGWHKEDGFWRYP